MTKLLLLARHATTGETYRGRYIGATDIPLSEEGAQQARDLARIVTKFSPTRCLASPLLRARQTADLLMEPAGLAVECVHDLREINFGRWEGLNFSEIAAADPDLVDSWAKMSPDFSFPAGESLADFLQRTSDIASRLASMPEETVLAVSHGGVIRSVICHLLGLPADRHLLFNIQHASLTVIEITGGRGVLVSTTARPAGQGCHP